MNFLSKLLQGIAFVPAVVNGIEGLFGGRSGNDKKDAALSFVQAALSMTDAIANRDLPVIQAIGLIQAAIYVVVNLTADLLTVLLTPRLRTSDA